VDTELSSGDWTLDTTATSIGFQAKAAFGMKVNGRFDQYESAITVGASAAESEISSVIWTTGLNVTGTLRVRDVSQSVTFQATRSITAGPPRYHATVVVSPKEYGITRWGTTKPVKVILDATLKRV
jgi:polyisoprenoid-binding protein YceI